MKPFSQRRFWAPFLLCKRKRRAKKAQYRQKKGKRLNIDLQQKFTQLEAQKNRERERKSGQRIRDCQSNRVHINSDYLFDSGLFKSLNIQTRKIVIFQLV